MNTEVWSRIIKQRCQNSQCGITYQRKGKTKFCSTECRQGAWAAGRERRAQTEKVCQNSGCAHKFTGIATKKYCSDKCRIINKDLNRRSLTGQHRNCDSCSGWYEISSVIDGKRSVRRKFCSARCQQISNNIRAHGISVTEYINLLRQQSWICGICYSEFDDIFEPVSENWHKRPVIDHDHATGAVRGILHNRCNLNLGIIEKSVQATKNCLIYLDKQSEAK